jgi:hypothetical protein
VGNRQRGLVTRTGLVVKRAPQNDAMGRPSAQGTNSIPWGSTGAPPSATGLIAPVQGFRRPR